MAVAALSAVRIQPVPMTVFVRGGRFVMGSDEGRPDERPPHEAEVRPLQVGRTPVTNAEYAVFLATGVVAEPPWWKDPAFWDPEQPVVGVTWPEAVAYCDWLRSTLGGRWRLPTEAEWEHAAVGGLDAPRTPWGAAMPPGEVPAPPRDAPWLVGRGTANGFGLLDPGTLVYEWCQDRYGPDAYRLARRYDPRGPEQGGSRVRRGCGWRGQAPPSARSGTDPLARAADGGFRVVREVP